ncbi:glycoside hydrolase [Vararia minispora EC-137]|uniref:Glycoside hydrolase n=1 Tax=Vararia minispora EC-137 TaxID=1314806 RepID=A0ACB8QID5_9AGAM|nr:glycoside hydrolase [Vararia minispora EC-137]
MVGNTFPYTINDWKADMQLAQANGIDGFALNVGRDDWQPARVQDAFEAARQLGTGFKLFISLPCASPADAAALRTYITTYATHPNQFIYRNRVYASSFSGETCTFGQSSVPQGWSSQFTRHADLSGQNAVYFVPSFFVDPATFAQYGDVMDGAMAWNSAWPIDLTSNSGSSGGLVSQILGAVSNAVQGILGGGDTDTQYLNALAAMPNGPDGNRTYLPTVSPWFFTHYGADSYNKNFVYYADSHLYPVRWEQLIANRDRHDVVEVLTWNDYGESSYIGPIAGAQPNSQAWVDGFDHTAFLNMTAYYAQAYKTGAYPAISQDRLFLWARPHAKDANAPDAVGKPSNFNLMSDTVWALVFAASPAQVVLSVSNSTSQTFTVPAGVTKLSVPITPGDTMHAQLIRAGVTVVDLDPDFTFQGSPQTYNYNAFVAAS